MSNYLTRGFDPSDLLPCPFCGGEAEWRDGSSTKPYIRCKGCGMRTGGSYACDKLKAAWNRRPDAPEKTCHDAGNDAAAFTCSECKCEFDISDWWGEPNLWNRDGVAIAPNYCPNCGTRIVPA